MANFNKVILLGNLTRDPVLRYLPSQMAVVDFGMAVNNKYRTKSGEEREDVLFIDCSCFGKGAEIINQYCQKGKSLLIEGRLKYETWEDKQGGGKRHKHTILVDQFQFVGGRDGGGARPAPVVAAAITKARKTTAATVATAVAAATASNNALPSAAPHKVRPEPPAPKRRPPTTRTEAPYGEEQQFKEDDIPF